MKNKMLMVGVVVILALSACNQPSAAPTTLTAIPPLKISLEGKEFSFTPARITAKVGQMVEVDMKNTGVILHDISIQKIALAGTAIVKNDDDEHPSDELANHVDEVYGDEMAVHVAVEAGHSGMVKFTPSEAGEYEFFCTVPGHKASGMVGKLIVVQQ